MNQTIENLLQAIPGEKPCGPDLGYDPLFDELEAITKGKPEVEMGSVVKPAEPPEWKPLRDKSLQFLQKSRHLRVAVWYCCSLLKLEGIPGFRDGLQLVRGLVESFWGSVHPMLDPEDKNDPTTRLNILSALTAPRGSLGGWITVTDYLFAAPLTQPKGGPPVTFDQFQAAQLKAKGGDGAPADAPDLSAVKNALAGGAEQLAANHAALLEAIEAVKALDQFLTATLGPGNTISFEVLQRTLEEIIAGIAPHVAGAENVVGSPTSTLGGDVAVSAREEAMTAGPGIKVSGSIRSRDDVIRVLESVCEYYRQVEPGSPVPLLLRRAQRLANMDFVAVMRELNLSTNDAMRPVLGAVVDGDGASA
jgi:type VI secretion system protein ImpA